ncbi:RNA-directed DNA polymerase, eukaryota [Tanacetum coccineum]
MLRYIEGDENSKFFHGIINKKRSQLSIRGVFVEGTWCTDPSIMKEAFKNHFEVRFQQPCHDRLKLMLSFHNRLSSDRWNEMDSGSIEGRNSKKKQAMFFKVDFAKAYDSVRWDYLLDILHAFGFGPNWCRWIRGTFTSSMASILVNGSPTSEFPFCCGLKQGDPLAPYLFILIMESLHISFSRVVDDGLFKGFQLHDSVNISHFIYADDACSLESGQVLGVGVSQNVVVQAANRIGCAVLNTPFRYLGVTVGECSKRRVEDYGIYGVDSSDRKISWVAWDNVLASKLNGGLGVSSFFALNRALLLKWVWRFISGDGSLWCKVIQAIYGSKFDLHVTDQPSIWCSILREVKSLKDSGFIFFAFFPVLFGTRIGRMFVVDNNMGAFSVSILFAGTWTCDLSGDGEFPRVKVIRTLLMSVSPLRRDVATSWRRGVCWIHFCVLFVMLAMEDIQLFFLCDVARVFLRKILSWVGFGWQVFVLSRVGMAWFLSLTFFPSQVILEGVFMLLGDGFGGARICCL